jgi:exodeoxyribonuclease III
MGKSIRILSWNVNGMRAIVKKGIYETIPGFKADIICFQETKAQPETMPPMQTGVPGYDLVFNSAVQKGYSGTAVLSRIKPVKHWMGTDNELHGQEGRVITMEFEDFYLMNVYVPNSGQELKRLDYRKEWDAHLRDYIQALDKKKPVVFTGDLNVAHEPIDLARPKENYNKVAGYTQVEIDGFKEFLKIDLVDTFRYFNKDKIQYTYWSQRFNARAAGIGWRIDYFLVSRRWMNHVKDAFILDQVMGSDHCPVGIDVEI